MPQIQGEYSETCADEEEVRRTLFGMFELDSANTVLYSRLEGGGNGDGAPWRAVAGQTFFGWAASFANADELRERINRFRSNGAKADSFDFNCQCADGSVPVRVLLARVHESSGYGRTKSVLVHIRERR